MVAHADGMGVMRLPRPTAYAAYGTVIAASLVALAWVYLWAGNNSTVADAEHERLIEGAWTMCAVLAIAAVVVWLAAAVTRATSLSSIVAGILGALIAVAAGAASTLLIAMAIAPATDPGDFGRPLFPIAYAGALALSLALAVDASWTAARRHGAPTAVAATGLALALTLAAWSYMAVGSSELNQCVVDNEFPLATDHVCSGY
jgi:hypothetical protein